MKLGLITTQRRARNAIRVAEACEAAGFWALGIGDTAPHLYQDAFVTTCACLEATSRLHVGPTVTNTITRHWSVLATMARTFEELQPGRFLPASPLATVLLSPSGSGQPRGLSSKVTSSTYRQWSRPLRKSTSPLQGPAVQRRPAG